MIKSQPEYVKQEYSSNGYRWNIVKNEAVNEIIFSNGDTAITGKYQKCRFRTDSLSYSRIHRTTSIGKKEVIDYHTQIPLKGKTTPIIFDKEKSFRHIYLNRLTSSLNQYVKNSSGKKIRTGISIPILPKKVTRLHSQFITMSEPDRKDNATTDISFYDIDQGLPISNVRNIFHDSRGHLWIATDVGVMKYDGKLLTVFSKKEGLSGNIVWDIFEDSKGNMWFTTFDGGITKYDGLFFYHLTELEGIPTNRVLSVNEDKHNNMWFSTDGGGLLMIKDDEMKIFS
ncbi:MAG: two-component regulator propeller domain-containing protein, partial [Candidatus Kapaibacteriota bacterium]